MFHITQTVADVFIIIFTVIVVLLATLLNFVLVLANRTLFLTYCGDSNSVSHISVELFHDDWSRTRTE